jgi:malonyl-CoA O-methyltransferase
MDARDPQALRPDPARVARGFDRRAGGFARAAFIEPTLRGRLLERLDLVRLAPVRVLDLGCACGDGAFALARRYPRARVLAVDRSRAMLRELRARRPWRLRRRVWPLLCDAAALPVADGSVDLVFSSLLLHWHPDPAAVFAEARRVLRPDGLLLFNTLGPDSLRELRQAWRTVDRFAHVNLFLDMHDLGDALQRAGLAAPVMDAETLQVSHPDAAHLWRDLRASSAGNVLPGRPRGLTGRGRHAALLAALDAGRRDGRLVTTLEVVYGHAWGRAQASPVPPGEIRVPLAELRGRSPATGR